VPFHRQDDPQSTSRTPATPAMGNKFESGRPIRAKLPSRGRVLCVFSDSDHVAEIEPKVSEKGFSLLRARPGIHGYWLAITSRPDVIITDVPEPGPGTDASYLLDCLNRNMKTRDIPVVAIIDTTQQEKAETSGLGHASLCVQRGVDSEDLLNRVDGLIDSSKELQRDKQRRTDVGRATQVDAVFSEFGGSTIRTDNATPGAPASSIPLLGPLRMPTTDSVPVS